MKRKLQFVIAGCAASVLGFSALAQDASNSPLDRSDKLPRAQHQGRLNEAAKASDVIGMTVKNGQGQKLGKVENLAVDVESGRIVQVILDSGGFAGLGDTLTPVPPGALRCDAGHKSLILDADKEKLHGAPRFEMSRWGEYEDSDHLSKVYSYYGRENAFKFIQTTDAVPAVQGNSDGTGGTCMIPASRLSQVQKASKLMGLPVKNLQDETIGKVENILVDLPAGRMVAVVVSSGGFLGMGDEVSAIPPTALRFTADRDALQIDISKEMLSSAPHFKADQWPDFAQPGYAAGVYSAYHVQPYFATDADNTARNVRDRNDRTLTPLNQGNSQADINTTSQIRKEIIAAKDMSVNARNVKIITMNGHVTLRGPVNTDEEKRLIGEIANRIARSENVDNQLEVKLTASNN